MADGSFYEGYPTGLDGTSSLIPPITSFRHPGGQDNFGKFGGFILLLLGLHIWTRQPVRPPRAHPTPPPGSGRALAGDEAVQAGEGGGVGPPGRRGRRTDHPAACRHIVA